MRNQHVIRALAAVCVAAVAASTVLASPAAAAPDDAGSDLHCVVVVGGNEPVAATRECRATQEEATAAVTSISPTATVKLMTVYEHRDYTGQSTSLWAPRRCSPEWQFEVPVIGATLGSYWNDRLTSYRVEGGCNVVTLWVDNHFRGSKKTLTGNITHVGNDINDKVSSMKLGQLV